MINLEQVKLLETKIANVIEHIERLGRENTAYRKNEAELQEELGLYQERIDELEVLITRFKEDQGKIEEGILSALDRLSQFEEAIEKSLRDKSAGKANKKKPAGSSQADAGTDGSGDEKVCFEIQEAVEEDEVLDLLEVLDDAAEPQGGEEKGVELDIF